MGKMLGVLDCLSYGHHGEDSALPRQGYLVGTWARPPAGRVTQGQDDGLRARRVGRGGHGHQGPGVSHTRPPRAVRPAQGSQVPSVFPSPLATPPLCLSPLCSQCSAFLLKTRIYRAAPRPGRAVDSGAQGGWEPRRVHFQGDKGRAVGTSLLS